MHVGMILEMAADSLGDRVAIGPLDGGLTFAELGHRARRAGTWLAAQPGDRVVLVDENSPAVPIALFGSAIAGKPFVPVATGWPTIGCARSSSGRRRAVVIAGAGVAARLEGVDGIEIVDRADFLATVEDESDRGDRRLGLRPRGHRRAAVHQRHHRRAEGRRAAPPEPRVLPRQLPRVRQRGRGRGHHRERPAVPHRVGVIGAVHHLHGPAGGAARELRCQAVGAARARRVRHPRHGRADDAQPHPRRRRGRRWGPAVDALARLRRWPDAAAGRRAGHATPRRARPRERLRPHRDVEHRRRPRSRRPPAAFASDDPPVRERLGSGRAGAARRRAHDPRSGGQPGGRRRAG